MSDLRCLTATVALTLLVAAFGCGDGEDVTRARAEDGIWEIEPGAVPVTTESGLIIYHVVEGKGGLPGNGSTVDVHYTGMFEDGSVFDSSYPRRGPLQFVLGRGSVIAGWEEGVALMQPGGRARLIIPPDLAYGSAGAGDGFIPPDATLTFDVWLVTVQ